MTYYKVLDEHRNPIHGGIGRWAYRKWMPHIDNIEACRRGYHVCREHDLVLWLGPTIWEVEIKGDVIELHDKVVASDARLVRKVQTWNKRTARLFACDCAEHVLNYADTKHVGILKNTIRVARRYANGKATDEERAAAWAAWGAREAAGAAALESSWAAFSAASLEASWGAFSASRAARKAARGASRAARKAAREAEHNWQTQRLVEYINGKRGAK